MQLGPFYSTFGRPGGWDEQYASWRFVFSVAVGPRCFDLWIGGSGNHVSISWASFKVRKESV